MLSLEMKGKEGLKEEEESHRVKSFTEITQIGPRRQTLDSVAGTPW